MLGCLFSWQTAHVAQITPRCSAADKFSNFTHNSSPLNPSLPSGQRNSNTTMIDIDNCNVSSILSLFCQHFRMNSFTGVSASEKHEGLSKSLELLWPCISPDLVMAIYPTVADRFAQVFRSCDNGLSQAWSKVVKRYGSTDPLLLPDPLRWWPSRHVKAFLKLNLHVESVIF